MRADYLNTYYNQEWVLKEIKNYFSIGELFSKAMCARYSESQLWSFKDPRQLANILFVRVKRGRSITINHGRSQQRGYRENTCPLVKSKTLKGRIYTSAHMLGAGDDYTEKNTPAEETRMWIVENAEYMPYPCRLEHKKNGVPIPWVHQDCNYEPKNGKVYLFDV